jgi:hypothetical protein
MFWMKKSAKYITGLGGILPMFNTSKALQKEMSQADERKHTEIIAGPKAFIFSYIRWAI